jgi:hypothetical protein
MEPNEIIGMAILSVVMILATAQLAYAIGHHVATAQLAYAIGHHVATKRERQFADRRVNGVLDYENARKPKTIKAKRKVARGVRLHG